MLPHLVLVALLGQAPAPTPQIAVVVTQRSGPGMPADRAELIASRISDVLVGRGVDISTGPKQSAALLATAGTANPAACQGKRGCVSGLGRLLRVWAVLGVELADLDGTLAVHLELVDSDKGQRLAQLDIVMPTKRAESDVAAQVMPIVVPLKEAQAAAQGAYAPAPPAPTVAPAAATKATAPAAAVEAAAAPAQTATASRGSIVPMAVTLGAGAVAGITSIIFVALASDTRNSIDAAGFNITRAQAKGLVERGNTQYTVALGCAVGATVLLALGLVLGMLR